MFKGLYSFQLKHAKYEGEGGEDGGGTGDAGGEGAQAAAPVGLFTETGINPNKVKEYLGDEFFNDPDTKQQPTKVFDNVKDEKTFVKNYLNSQRKISQGEKAFEEKLKGMVRIPGEKATAEEISAYRKSIGVPEKPEDYKLDIPEGDKLGLEITAALVKTAAHKMGLPATALSGVWSEVVESVQAQDAELVKKGQQMMEADEAALKEKYKEKYPEFVKTTEAVLAKAKSGPEVAKILEAYGLNNHPAVRELLNEIAPFVLEGKTVVGDVAPTGSSGATQVGFSTYLYHPGGAMMTLPEAISAGLMDAQGNIIAK